MRKHVDTTYDLEDCLPLVTSHKDGTVSLHVQQYQEGIGVSVRFNTRHIETVEKLLRELKKQQRKEKE